LLVLAGAGSGKTRVLTARIAHLVTDRGISPGRVLAVTFTNKAAAEMKRRIAALLGRDPGGLWIGTFHSLCARLLRREAARLGFTPQYTIYDENDRLALIKRLMEARELSTKTFPPRLMQSVISNAKNRLLSPEELGAAAEDRVTRVAADIYHDMGAALARANAMDFDDLLLHPLTLFREHPDRLEFYQRRFDAVLVDEFQDLDFRTDFPDSIIVRLEENYRSTQVILDAANGVIADNTTRMGKTLFTSRGGGELVVVVQAADERDEAEWLARELRSLCANGVTSYQDVAVLYRTNAQSRAFEEAFRRSAVPHRVVGAVSFYDRREVKDLLAYLRLVANPADDEAFVRAVQVPRRGIGIGSLRTLRDGATAWKRPLLDSAGIADRIHGMRTGAKQALQDFAELFEVLRAEAAEASPAALLERIIELIEYEEHLKGEGFEGVERLENVRELVAAAAEWSEELGPDEIGTPVERFLQSAALTTSEEKISGDPDGVTLMTVHTAKGLEWPVVAIAGLEDGLFPLSRAMESPEGMEEERRLAYVAVTRAQDRLYLIWARARRRGGQIMPGTASRFIESLPPGVVEERRTSGLFGGEWYRPAPRQRVRRTEEVSESELESQDLPRFVKGERVHHRRFGPGVIRGVSGRGRDLKVIVDFEDDEVGEKHLLVAYAGLQRSMEGA
jgi:DNA helicase-2/ATP-dependent DNA helicase PcrA